MTEPRRPAPRFPGLVLTLLPLAGLAVGTAWRQPSLGLVTGLASAILIVVAAWALGRR